MRNPVDDDSREVCLLIGGLVGDRLDETRAVDPAPDREFSEGQGRRAAMGGSGTRRFVSQSG